MNQLSAWLRIARLQFYPMVLVTYGVGAAAARATTGEFDWTLCVLGYTFLFFIELATAMSNEYFDYSSDVVNANASLFSGGSRVLVDGRLSFGAVRAAIVLACVACALVSAVLLIEAPPERAPAIVTLLAMGMLLGIGYTAPPLKLSYRGLGELDVAFMHSVFVTLLGYVVQTGDFRHHLPYVLSVPSFFAVLCAITLAGIPDHTADESVGKRSYSVRFGRTRAAAIALAAAIAAGASGLMLWLCGVVAGKVGGIFLLAAAHSLVLALALARFIGSGDHEGRIDPIMLNVLNFNIWFGVVPLIYYLRS
jgi:1,4-dihydroxy-2-naphthoate octaprenyltransferase